MDNFLWMAKIMCMPMSMSIFATIATHLLGIVTDLKHMAQYSDYLLNDNLGLKNCRSCFKLMALVLPTLLGLTVCLPSLCWDKGNSQCWTKDIRRLFIWITISHSRISTTSCNCRSIQVNLRSYLNILDLKTLYLFRYIY